MTDTFDAANRAHEEWGAAQRLREDVEEKLKSAEAELSKYFEHARENHGQVIGPPTIAASASDLLERVTSLEQTLSAAKAIETQKRDLTKTLNDAAKRGDS